MFTEVLKISVNYQIEYYHGKLKIQLAPITRTLAHSNCFLFPSRVWVTIVLLYYYYCIIPQELGYILITSNFHEESNIFLMFKMKIQAKIISAQFDSLFAMSEAKKELKV